MFTKHLQFLTNLEFNNNRERFHEHKATYDQLRKELILTAEELIRFLSAYYPLDDISPKQCIFRINRDSRFSKNKAPYKTNFGIEIAPGGKRSGLPSFYLHIQPGEQSFFGGGLYAPEAEITASVRQKILSDGKTLQKLYQQNYQNGFHDFSDRALKTAPRGYDRNHKDIELIRQRDRIFSRAITDKELGKKDALEYIKEERKKLIPFCEWLLDAAERF